MLTREEKEMIILGLQMRSNYVQTGCINLTLNDFAAMGESTFKSLGGKIKALSTDQMQLIIDTEKLVSKIMNQL